MFKKYYFKIFFLTAIFIILNDQKIITASHNHQSRIMKYITPKKPSKFENSIELKMYLDKLQKYYSVIKWPRLV